jgi:hypothetical protein
MKKPKKLIIKEKNDNFALVVQKGCNVKEINVILVSFKKTSTSINTPSDM